MATPFTHPFILMKKAGNIPSICCQPTAGFKRGTAPLGSINSTAQQEREKEREADRQRPAGLFRRTEGRVLEWAELVS